MARREVSESSGRSAEATRSSESTGAGAAIGRRTVLAGAALAVPAVTMMVSTPAWAASGESITLSAPAMCVPASGGGRVTALVKDAANQPLSGTAVSFSGPSGASFSPSSSTTSGAGEATTQLDLGTPWATPGSTVTVTAVTATASTSMAFTVSGSNLLLAGRDNPPTLTQSALAFPSPVVDAVGSGWENKTPSFLALLADGTVWAKGGSDFGQLGDGTTTSRFDWLPVPGLSGVTQIAAAANSSYALLSDGSVRAWGRNAYGELGIGSTTDQLSPVAVPALTSGVTRIAAGAGHVLALLSDGSLRAWGYNGPGQVGDGTTTDRWTPVQVLGLRARATAVAAGSFASYAILSDGSVMAWGSNGYGELGIGTTDDQWSPVAVGGLSSNVVQIAGGAFSAYALLSDGSVKAWGSNGDGQLGDGSGTDQTTPVPVSGLNSGVTQIAAGVLSGYALSTDGRVRAWGSNDIGQLGDGSAANQRTPVVVPLPSGRQAQRLGAISTGCKTVLILTKTS